MNRFENQSLLPNFLIQNGLQKPHKIALTTATEQLTFGQFQEQVVRLAGQLAAQGVSVGSRVALLMGNRREFAEIAQAVMQLQAVLVPLNLRLTPAELNWQLNDVEAQILVSDTKQAEKAQSACPANIALWLIEELEQTAGIGFEPPESLNPANLYTIVYSSGTTGNPKGVQHTLLNHYANAQASRQNLPIGETDCWLAVLPLFHVGGLAILMRGLFYGMRVLLQESFEPGAVNRALDSAGVTIISVVANMLSRLLDERNNRAYPASFRCMLVGGGPVPQVLLERCVQAGVPVMQTYGMTETTSQAATLAPEDALRKLGSAGKPLAGVELRIEQDGMPIPAGQVGEIALRGAIVTLGYANRPEATAQAWRGGWFHSGDLGYLDEEDFLYIVDRRDDLIISGGENIYPAEIEAALLAHPAVEEACVTGVLHEKWGQVPVAFVKLRAGYTLEEAALLEYCRERLARYKIPQRIIFSAENLPRNAAGKLLRRVLRQQIQ